MKIENKPLGKFVGMVLILVVTANVVTVMAHDDFKTVIPDIKPIVVKIKAKGRSRSFDREAKNQRKEVLGEFEDFYQQQGASNSSVKLGSGIIVSEQGHVLTAFHVVRWASKVQVTTHLGDVYDATLLKFDKTADIALLKIQTNKANPTASLAAELPYEGQSVVAVGSAFGLSVSSSGGIISALNVFLPGRKKVPLIQTDAAINPGSSGGGLFGSNGELIGLISQIFSSTGTFSGSGFAIPAHELRNRLMRWKVPIQPLPSAQ